MLEVPAPEAGVLEAIIEEEGATVLSKQLIAKIKPGAVAGEPTKIRLRKQKRLQINAIKLL